jgi:AcrR family transcriptional regulator
VSASRGNYAAGRARRERILDIATERFAAQGYARTSLAEIARAAELTTPGLIHHFPSKLHLLLAIADRRYDLAANTARRAPADPDGLGPLRLMLEVAEQYAAQPALMELWVAVVAEASDPDSPARELYEQRYASAVGELAGAFESAREAGHLRDDLDYHEIARECVAVSDGAQLQWVLGGGGVDVLGIIRTHLERLAPAILAPGNDAQLTP